jgi:hypothetical protein
MVITIWALLAFAWPGKSMFASFAGGIVDFNNQLAGHQIKGTAYLEGEVRHTALPDRYL